MASLTPLIKSKSKVDGGLSSRSQFTGKYCGVNMYQIPDRDVYNSTGLTSQNVSKLKSEFQMLNKTVSVDMASKQHH